MLHIKLPGFSLSRPRIKGDSRFKADDKVCLVSGEIGFLLLSIAYITSYTGVICYLEDQPVIHSCDKNVGPRCSSVTVEDVGRGGGSDIVLRSFLAAGALRESICCQRSRFRTVVWQDNDTNYLLHTLSSSSPLISISYIHICMCS